MSVISKGVVVAMTSVACCSCVSQTNPWTPTLTHREATALLAKGCRTPALPAPPESARELRELGPIGEVFRTVETLRGLPPLERSVVPPGTRELRIAVGFGLLYPQVFLRLVVDGDDVSGDLFAWWPADIDEESDDDGLPTMPQVMAERCREARGDAEIVTCRYCLDERYDWDSVLAFLEKHEVWDLPDESELPETGFFVADGVSMFAELADAGTFRGYSYGNPDRRSEPEAKAAAAIIEFINALPP